MKTEKFHIDSMLDSVRKMEESISGIDKDFFIKKELPLSKVYKVDFKGKPKDIQTVVDYIKNRPKVKF